MQTIFFDVYAQEMDRLQRMREQQSQRVWLETLRQDSLKQQQLENTLREQNTGFEQKLAMDQFARQQQNDARGQQNWQMSFDRNAMEDDRRFDLGAQRQQMEMQQFSRQQPLIDAQIANQQAAAQARLAELYMAQHGAGATGRVDSFMDSPMANILDRFSPSMVDSMAQRAASAGIPQEAQASVVGNAVAGARERRQKRRMTEKQMSMQQAEGTIGLEQSRAQLQKTLADAKYAEGRANNPNPKPTADAVKSLVLSLQQIDNSLQFESDPARIADMQTTRQAIMSQLQEATKTPEQREDDLIRELLRRFPNATDAEIDAMLNQQR